MLCADRVPIVSTQFRVRKIAELNNVRFGVKNVPRRIQSRTKIGAAPIFTRPSPAQADLVLSEAEVEKEFRSV